MSVVLGAERGPISSIDGDLEEASYLPKTTAKSVLRRRPKPTRRCEVSKNGIECCYKVPRFDPSGLTRCCSRKAPHFGFIYDKESVVLIAVHVSRKNEVPPLGQ